MCVVLNDEKLDGVWLKDGVEVRDSMRQDDGAGISWLGPKMQTLKETDPFTIL